MMDDPTNQIYPGDIIPHGKRKHRPHAEQPCADLQARIDAALAYVKEHGQYLGYFIHRARLEDILKGDT